MDARNDAAFKRNTPSEKYREARMIEEFKMNEDPFFKKIGIHVDRTVVVGISLGLAFIAVILLL